MPLETSNPRNNYGKMSVSEGGDEERGELFEESFVDRNWVKLYGLSELNVLDYFACSQFYDLSCNNEKLRMQNRDLKGLVNMVGLEYVLELNDEVRKHQPFLFIICKQRRVSPNQIVKLAKYYVLDMIIYQAPNLHSLFLSRVSKFCTYIQNSFHFLAAAAHHSPNEGNTWRFDVEGSEAWNKSIEVAMFESRRKFREEMEERRAEEQIGQILNGLVETYTPDLVPKSEDADNTRTNLGKRKQ